MIDEALSQNQITALKEARTAQLAILERQIRLDTSRLSKCQRCHRPGTCIFPIWYDAERDEVYHVTRIGFKAQCPPKQTRAVQLVMALEAVS